MHVSGPPVPAAPCVPDVVVGSPSGPESEPSVAIASRRHAGLYPVGRIGVDAISSGADRRRGPHAVLGPALLADDPVALRTYRGAVSRVVPTRLVATRLGDLLEALEVTLHAAVDHAERGADVLEEAL